LYNSEVDIYYKMVETTLSISSLLVCGSQRGSLHSNSKIFETLKLLHSGLLIHDVIKKLYSSQQKSADRY